MSSNKSLPQTQRSRVHERGEPSAPRPSTPPSTVATDTILEKAIQRACDSLGRIFCSEDDDDLIQENLSVAWTLVHMALSQAGDLNLKERLRDKPDFDAYVNSNREKEELIKLLRSMANQKVPWKDLFKHGTLLSSCCVPSTLITILYLY